MQASFLFLVCRQRKAACVKVAPLHRLLSVEVRRLRLAKRIASRSEKVVAVSETQILFRKQTQFFAFSTFA